jgi:hypothetical protein
MANTNPVNDSAAVTRYILEQARGQVGARLPDRCRLAGLEGRTLAEIGEMRRAGIVAVSDDGMPIMDAGSCGTRSSTRRSSTCWSSRTRKMPVSAVAAS